MDELAARIEARLNEALDRQVAADFYPVADRGLIDANDPVADYDVPAPVRLSMADVARIAAAEAIAWF